MTRLFVLVFTCLVFATLNTPAAAQNYTCSHAVIDSTFEIIEDQIPKLRSAITLEVDVDTIMEVFGLVGNFFEQVKALCAGTYFQSEDVGILGTIEDLELPEGVYFVLLSSDEDVIVESVVTDGDCESSVWDFMGGSKSYLLFESSGCTLRLDITGDEEWSLQISGLLIEK